MVLYILDKNIKHDIKKEMFTTDYHIDGMMQDCTISIANALEIL